MTTPPAVPFPGAGSSPITPPALGQIPVGGVIEWPGPATIPGDWLESYGQSLLRASYPRLFSALNVVTSTATVTAASPAVFTAGAHGLLIGQPIFFRVVSGVTGISANVTYYVATVPTANTYTIAATRTIDVITGAITPGASLNTGGVAGLAEAWSSPYEIADATHFYLPDYRGRVGLCIDNMGGSDAGVIAWPNILGLRAGEATHTQLVAEIAAHQHTIHASTGGAVVANLVGFKAGTNDINFVTDNAGGGTPFNVIQPSIAIRKIIYAGVTA